MENRVVGQQLSMGGGRCMQWEGVQCGYKRPA